VESVLAQSVVPGEIIVVDDGSRDDTVERLAPYEGRVRFLRQENQGVAAARNTGLAQASGDFIAFLDADDAWHPQKLERQLQAFARFPDAGLVGTEIWEGPTPGDFPVANGDKGAGGEKGSVPQEKHRDQTPLRVDWVPLQRLVVKNCFTTSSVMVRRQLLERVGSFDPQLHGPEDYDLWLRIAEVAKIGILRTRLTYHRTIPGTLGNQVATMEAGMERILHKLDGRGAWQGRPLLRRKAYSYFHYSCALMHRKVGNRGAALARLVRSVAWYPWPYRRSEVRIRMARPKVLLMTLVRRRERTTLA
jgi:glycosyltransferase involved in cell wall biosynthesis